MGGIHLAAIGKYKMPQGPSSCCNENRLGGGGKDGKGQAPSADCLGGLLQ